MLVFFWICTFSLGFFIGYVANSMLVIRQIFKTSSEAVASVVLEKMVPGNKSNVQFYEPMSPKEKFEQADNITDLTK